MIIRKRSCLYARSKSFTGVQGNVARERVCVGVRPDVAAQHVRNDMPDRTIPCHCSEITQPPPGGPPTCISARTMQPPVVVTGGCWPSSRPTPAVWTANPRSPGGRGIAAAGWPPYRRQPHTSIRTHGAAWQVSSRHDTSRQKAGSKIARCGSGVAAAASRHAAK